MNSIDLPKIFTSASLVFIGTIFGRISGLAERLIIGRAIGVEQYGSVSILLSLVMFSSILCLFGLSEGVPRYISRLENRRDRRGIWISATILSAVLSIAIVVLLVFSSERLSDILLKERVGILFEMFVLSIPFIALTDINVGVIRGYENTKYRVLSKDLLYPFIRIFILAVGIRFGLGIQSAGFAYLIGSFGAFLSSGYLAARLLSPIGEFKYQISSLSKFSAPLMISSAMAVLLTQTDTLMLGYFKGSLQTGLYSAAYPLAAGLQIVLGAFGFIYLPLASKLDADDASADMNRIYTLTTKWVFIITFPAFLVFTLFSSQTIRLFWGETYQSAGTALGILSAGFFSNAIVGRNRETLSAIGETKIVMYSNVLAYVVNVFLNILLIPPLGFAGSAVSSALSYILMNICIYLILRINFGVTPYRGQVWKIYTSIPLIQLPLFYATTRIISVEPIHVPLILMTSGVLNLIIIYVGGFLNDDDMIVISELLDKVRPIS
ncbi:flippase [Haloarcula sp. Atlit-120R]|uniref:flippase n=1 Tax=Haloarcula sp. Atlit-120R TaxID=2282135 RepID=UPI000EF23AA2|nr:flippase [Haloarcula sp. Atlit-120R]RLM33850.1 flippase [Haloarcula sp. Atlit-120R]